MATLDELMEGGAPGSVTVRQKDWPITKTFRPYYTGKSYGTYWWYGLTEDGHTDTYMADGGGNYWELYQEPPQEETWVEYWATPVSLDIVHSYVVLHPERYKPSSDEYRYTPTGRTIKAPVRK